MSGGAGVGKKLLNFLPGQGGLEVLKEKVRNRVLDMVEREELLDLLQELIKIPSHKQVEWQEDRVVQFIYNYLQGAGFSDLKLQYIMENRPNILARLPGKGGGRSLLFNGHTDTVPPYNMVIHPHQPLIKDGFLYGLGAVDMKGSLAAMLLAMVLVKRAGIALQGDLLFTGVIDQEQCSLGTVDLVRRGFKADYAVVGEPTNLDICVAHKGMEWMKIIVRGRSAHGSTPDKGRNPIYMGARIAREIEKLNNRLQDKYHPLVGSPSINVGVMSGGDDPNIVPQVCFLELDRRWTPEETLESLYRDVEQILNRLKLAYPGYQYELLPMDYRTCPLRNIPLDVDPDELIVRSLRRNLKEFTGKDSGSTSFRGWSDAALLSRDLGIPAVVFGPGQLEKAHAADEGVEIEKLMIALRVYLGLILDICGCSEEGGR